LYPFGLLLLNLASKNLIPVISNLLSAIYKCFGKVMDKTNFDINKKIFQKTFLFGLGYVVLRKLKEYAKTV
jgi:hypothetical protein